jgi:hypothetical protein
MNSGVSIPIPPEGEEILPREVQYSNFSPDIEHLDFFGVSMQMLVQLTTASFQVLSNLSLTVILSYYAREYN